jgi:sporulation-control protein spo0M
MMKIALPALPMPPVESIAHGALSVEASVDQSGYWPGQSVRARVVVTVSRDAPDSVSLHQLSLQCCGHERLDPTWVRPEAPSRGEVALAKARA